MEVRYTDYARLMIPFLRSLPDAMRTCAADPLLRYYGTGDSGHWAVQSSQQVLSALAVLSVTPDLASLGSPLSADELRELALSMLRYSLRTHLTGDLECVEGARWGRHWISVLGLERGVMGLNILLPYMNEDDRARLRALDLFEADYRLADYPVHAAIDASTGFNVPESNIWNAGFLFRAAANYPDAPNASAYIEKATKMMLAGLSRPSDAESGELFLGRPLREWYTGPNFTENWSLDHHHYMNVGYAFVCLSNIACLYYNFRDRGQEIPDSLLHNVRPLWEVLRNFVFPDGRLLRAGGDTRSRYTYCQNFAQQAFILAADLFCDEDAVRFEKGYLDIIATEQAANTDGTFFGRRLASLREESYYFYRRLEADPFFALACGAYWRRRFEIKGSAGDRPRGPAGKPILWHDDFHSAVLLRTEATARSVTAASPLPPVPAPRFYSTVGGHSWTPNALCVPLGRSDMAEWAGNLSAFVGLRFPIFRNSAEYSVTDNSFRWTASGEMVEQGPVGEGEPAMAVARRTLSVTALPDGRTMVFADKLVMTREYAFVHGFRTLHGLVPNDVHNGYSRLWRGESFSLRTETAPGEISVADTGCRVLNVDDSISFYALSGPCLKLYREAKQNIMLYNSLTSIYADEVCMDCELEPVRRRPGETVFDVVYAVAAGTTLAEAMSVPSRGRIEGEGSDRKVHFRGFDGVEYTVPIPE